MFVQIAQQIACLINRTPSKKKTRDIYLTRIGACFVRRWCMYVYYTYSDSEQLLLPSEAPSLAAILILSYLCTQICALALEKSSAIFFEEAWTCLTQKKRTVQPDSKEARTFHLQWKPETVCSHRYLQCSASDTPWAARTEHPCTRIRLAPCSTYIRSILCICSVRLSPSIHLLQYKICSEWLPITSQGILDVNLDKHRPDNIDR